MREAANPSRRNAKVVLKELARKSPNTKLAVLINASGVRKPSKIPFVQIGPP